jgi:hypothetical protein
VDRAAQRTAALHPGMASIRTSSTVQPVTETQDGMTSGIGGSCTLASSLHQRSERIELHRRNLSWAHTSAVDNERDGAYAGGTPTNVATTVEPAPGLSSTADHAAVSTDPAALDPHVVRNVSLNTCRAASLAPHSPEPSPATAQHATSASTHAHAVAEVSERASDAECGQHDAYAAAMSSRVYPVSSDGSCPYCGSWNVQHLISPHALQQWRQAAATPGGAAAVAACATASASAWEITSVEDGATSANQAGEAAAVAGDAASTGEVGGWQPLSTVTTSTLLSDTPSVDSTDGGVSGVGVDCADADAGLPWVVLRLLELRRAVKVTVSSECPEPSSFRCIDCSYVAPTALHMWTRVRSCPLLLFFVLVLVAGARAVFVRFFLQQPHITVSTCIASATTS